MTTPNAPDGYMTDLITRRSVEFINQNATRPFFIDVAFNAPHSPTQRPDDSARTSAATRDDKEIKRATRWPSPKMWCLKSSRPRSTLARPR